MYLHNMYSFAVSYFTSLDLDNYFHRTFCVWMYSGFKNLRSLEICGGGLTDAGVKNIKDLKTLTLLNLSQNHHLTDKSLEAVSGISINLFFLFVLHICA